MKEANLVIGQAKTLVCANEVDYVDFKRIFQCPECRDIVKLRSGYWRSSDRAIKNTWVEPTFVHSKGNPDECGDRTSSSACFDDVFTAIARGQNTKKLERAFLRCLNTSLKGEVGSRMYGDRKLSQEEKEWLSTISTSSYIKRYKDYNGAPGIVHETPELLIDTFATILSTSKFIHEVADRIQRWKPRNASGSYPEYFIKKSIATNTTVSKLKDQNCIQLVGILDYICVSASEHLRREFSKSLIWVDYKNLPVPPHEVETTAGWQYRKRWMIPLAPRLSVEESYYANFKHTQYQQTEQDRRAYVLRIEQFTPYILGVIKSRSLSHSGVFANSEKGQSFIENDMFELLIEKFIWAVKITNWEKLPELYDSRVFHLDWWEKMSISELQRNKAIKEKKEKYHQWREEKMAKQRLKKWERAERAKERAEMLKLKTKKDTHRTPILKAEKQLTTSPKPLKKSKIYHAPILKA